MADKKKIVIPEPPHRDSTYGRIFISENEDKDFRGDMTMIDVDAVRQYFTESVYTQLIDVIDKYCEETGAKLDISWEDVRQTLALKDSGNKKEFDKLLKSILSEYRDSLINEKEESQDTVQRQIVPQTQLQEITRAVMVMNYDIDDNSERFSESYYIDPDNKNLGYVTLTLVNATGEPLRLLPYERSVASALWSYFKKAGTDRGFTYKDITRFILHREHVSKESVQEVKEVIQKFRHIDTLIDYKTHVKAKYTTNIVKRYLAPVDEVTIKHANGYIDEGIKFIATPPLFQFADDTGEILSTDIKYLDIPINMHLKTEVPIRDYLLRRINQIKRGNPKERQDKILLSSIMEKCGQKPYKDLTRTEKSRLREKIETMLDTFKQGLIKDYKPSKTGKEISGYHIIIDSEEKK